MYGHPGKERVAQARVGDALGALQQQRRGLQFGVSGSLPIAECGQRLRTQPVITLGKVRTFAAAAVQDCQCGARRLLGRRGLPSPRWAAARVA